MYLGARRLGISDRWFWAATPKELKLEVEARKDIQQAQKSRMWILAAMIRAKRLPNYKAFVGEIDEKPQHWQDIKAQVTAGKQHESERPTRRTRQGQ